MTKIDLKGIQLPESVKRNVREKLIKKHIPGLSHLGMFYLPRIKKSNLTFSEKLLLAFYAYEAALDREDYDVLGELAGYCLFGFVEGNYYELADTLIDKLVDPNLGGTLDMNIILLLNLRYLKDLCDKSTDPAEYIGKRVKVDGFIDKVKAGIDKNLEGLYAMGKLVRHQKLIDRRDWVLLNVVLPLVLGAVLFFTYPFWRPVIDLILK